jgi:hypothetical protein
MNAKNESSKKRYQQTSLKDRLNQNQLNLSNSKIYLLLKLKKIESDEKLDEIRINMSL